MKPDLRRQLQYISRDGAALAAGVAVTNLLAVLVPVTYNAFRSVEGYGIYTFIMSVMAVAGMSSLSGMNSAILVAAAQEKFHILRTATRRRVHFSLAVGCPGLLAAGLAMLQWFPQQRLVGYACFIFC
ncbi:MAG: hypothetical protein N3D11_13995 [Candidatus Sumerlaeia bacterium]|nr:hypothetical protein [Candidatus Sumerlaeia bacterium]